MHWSDVSERGGVLGMRFLFATYRALGRRAFTLLLYPVAGYFYLMARGARDASVYYLGRVREQLAASERTAPTRLTTFAHIMQFGQAVLDKGAMWAGAFPADEVEFDDPAAFERFRRDPRGALFIGSHLGNLEVLRAFGDTVQGLKVNALVFTRHSPKFNRVLASVSPRALERTMQVDSLGPNTVAKLAEKIAAGEHVAIVADRVSVHHKERSIHAPFLGRPAPFPEGPFILASLLACPVYLIHCLRVGAKYRVFLEPFADPLELPRERRREMLERAIARYAERLEAHCLLAPTQWFNFFPFWDQANHTLVEQHVRR